MRVCLRTGQPGLCLGIIVILGTLPVLPAHGEEPPDDILTLSQQMVEREQAGDDPTALRLAQRALALAEAAYGPDAPAFAIYVDYVWAWRMSGSAMCGRLERSYSGRWPSERRRWEPTTWRWPSP